MHTDLNTILNYIPLQPLLATAGQPTVSQFPLIAQAGFKLVINLALPTSHNAIPEEADIVTRLGMNYLHIPVIWEQPTVENLEQFFSVLEQHAHTKKFIHCAMNMRVSVFMLLYFVIKKGWRYADALNNVREIWQPDTVWQSFIEQNMQRYGLHAA